MPFSTLSGGRRLRRPSWSSGPQSPQVEPCGRFFQRGFEGFASGISAHFHQLLQAAEAGRKRLALGTAAPAPISEGDLADIDVAVAVHSKPVRRDELPGVEARM